MYPLLSIEEFWQLGINSSVAVQVAASGNAEVVSLEDVSQEMLERERKIELQKEDLQSKPLAIRYTPPPPSHQPTSLFITLHSPYTSRTDAMVCIVI